MQTTYVIIIAAYLGAGIYCFFWIKRDAEFRAGPWVLLGLLSIPFWPVAFLVWMLIRGDEHLTSIAAKQTHRDYQQYMRTKKDKDLFTSFDKMSEIAREKAEKEGTSEPQGEEMPKEGGTSQDFNIESLINNGRLDEALSTAQHMKKIARGMADEVRLQLYDSYIDKITELKSMQAE